MKLWRELEPGEKADGQVRHMCDAGPIVHLVPHDSQWPEPRDVRTDPPPMGERLLFDSRGKEWCLVSNRDASHLGPCWTHWLPLPPAPPQKSEAEMAWEKAYGWSDNTNPNEKSFFLAGFEAAKKGKA